MSVDRSKLAVGRPRVTLACINQTPTARILTPKDSGESTLEILTNIIHQVDLRSLVGLCFFVCKMKPGDDFLVLHVSYNPPSS